MYDARFKCAGCGARTSVTAGTIFDRTRTPLTVWFTACWLFASGKDAGDVVLALVLLEVDQVQAPGGDVVVQLRGERLGHLPHQLRGHEPPAPVVTEEPVDPLPVLQPGLAQEQQHPVHRPDLEPYVTGQDLSSSAR